MVAAAKTGRVLCTGIDTVFITTGSRKGDVRHGKEDQESCKANMNVPHCSMNIEHLLLKINAKS